ncbi:hypothetical protein EV363DRAFT_1295577 [Boletus edulis]|nr:hypothetical protein EV363DRAFT_1295577 [Boletus edulis]
MFSDWNGCRDAGEDIHLAPGGDEHSVLGSARARPKDECSPLSSTRAREPRMCSAVNITWTREPRMNVQQHTAGSRLSKCSVMDVGEPLTAVMNIQQQAAGSVNVQWHTAGGTSGDAGGEAYLEALLEPKAIGMRAMMVQMYNINILGQEVLRVMQDQQTINKKPCLCSCLGCEWECWVGQKKICTVQQEEIDYRSKANFPWRPAILAGFGTAILLKRSFDLGGFWLTAPAGPPGTVGSFQDQAVGIRLGIAFGHSRMTRSGTVVSRHVQWNGACQGSGSVFGLMALYRKAIPYEPVLPLEKYPERYFLNLETLGPPPSLCQ